MPNVASIQQWVAGDTVSEAGEGTLLRMDAALGALSSSVDRLESATANRVSTGDLLLAGELRDAREENARLQDNLRVAGGRLDSALDRLRLALGE